jgi:single-strand DNA-binding protein
MILGNLTADPELRYTPTGTAVLEFTLALNNNYTKSSGEKVEEVSFIDCVKFGDGAEKVCEYLKKGRQLHVEGRLKQERWETDQGQKRSKIRVTADRLTFIGGQGKKGEEAPAASDDMNDVKV